MSRHFIGVIGCDIPSVTSHLSAYLLLGSLGKQEDQLWPVCLFSCQSARLIPPRGTPSHPETRDPAMWTISLQREKEGKRRWKEKRDKGNLPRVNTAACCCHPKPVINHSPKLLVVTAARTCCALKAVG